MNRTTKAGKANSAQGGFTIIELLIVLAIAGLILLIVFEALPTLQRVARNDSRNQDAIAILEAVSHYELNNSGNLPPLCGGGSCPANFNILVPKLSYYSLANLSIHPQTALLGNLDGSTLLNPDDIQVFNYEICQPLNSNPIAVDNAAGYSNVVVIYKIEQGNGPPITQCKQL